MTYVMVDIEADGPIPGDYSMVCFGAVLVVNDTFASFKHLRKTPHTHNPVDDALGNAAALLHMKESLGLKIKL